jgi:hypothetical protein
MYGLVIDHFQGSSDRIRRKIGIDLSRLRSNRNRADYDDILGQPTAQAQFSVAIARSVLKALNSL